MRNTLIHHVAIFSNRYESIIQKELHVLQRDNRNERQGERQLVSV